MCVGNRSLRGIRVALEGRFASLTRAQLADVIRQTGGNVDRSLGPHTGLLVLGQATLPLEDLRRWRQRVEEVQRLPLAGPRIEVLGEEEFLAELGLIDDGHAIRRRYTIGQLARILGISAVRIRAWMRLGLVEPVEVLNQVALFDYHQMCLIRGFVALTRTGLRPNRLRAGLERLRHWFPKCPGGQFESIIVGPSRRLFWRRPDGRLLEASGQLHFDFLAEAQISCMLLHDPRSADKDWFDHALALEDAGHLQEALAAYLQAVRLDQSDPILHFNLGNVLYALGEMEEAASRFQRAVAIDPTYVEGWNNLGVILGELGRAPSALEALRRAVRLLPSYADAHFNLAETCYELGRIDEACCHWSAYLQYDSQSPWADRARTGLRCSRSHSEQ
ncbi:MAG: tetratricopeptide repeat protein [Pirellulaceae bacterium]